MLKRITKCLGLILVICLGLSQREIFSQDTDAPEPGAQKTPAITNRPKPRPELSAEERAKQIQELRTQYEKPTAEWPAPKVDEGVKWQELGLLPPMQYPESNPFSKDKAQLGGLLFFDPRLSSSKQVACASCHDPDLGWADGRTTSFGNGRKPLARNAPTVLNAGYFDKLFWDGRADSLEDQAHKVLHNPNEMDSNEKTIQANLQGIKEYEELFTKAFGSPEITIERVTKAIATFERILVGRTSRFDAFLKGKKSALSDEAIVGLDIFRRQANCMNCHHGPTLSDKQFHNVGLSYYGRLFEDLGRYHISKEQQEVGSFKTPTLRNITNTAPYMHNGLFELENVLAIYNAGMPTLVRKEHQKDDALFPTKSKHLKPLSLNRRDLADLKAFLESLAESQLRVRAPLLPNLHDAPYQMSSSSQKATDLAIPKPMRKTPLDEEKSPIMSRLNLMIDPQDMGHMRPAPKVKE
jgi:cytochrome c peroxidase